MEYYLLCLGLFFPLLGVCVQLGQGPHNEALEKRFLIPPTSKLRGIIPFREDPTNPFVYLKIIPLLASIAVSFIILLLYGVGLLAPHIITPIITHPLTLMITLLLALLYMIYAGIMNVI
jgi:hypothetical protein